jgi:hypothetical protein
MDLIGLAAIITAIGSWIFNATRMAAMARSQDEAKRKQDEADRRETLNRKDIILIGEQLAITRIDAAKMALLIDQLYRQYETAIGQPPAVDLDMIRHMRELYYITGPLGPIDTNAAKSLYYP